MQLLSFQNHIVRIAKPPRVSLIQTRQNMNFLNLIKSVSMMRNEGFKLTFLADGAALQDALEEITGQRSVPNIFIKQQHIGGNSDLQAKKSQLLDLLKQAGAV